MKIISWIVGAVLMVLVAACSHDEMIEPNLQKSGVSFNLHDFQLDPTSRTTVEITEQAAVFTWSENDMIGIFPDTDASQARFLMKSGAGTKTATFDGGGWALKPDMKYASYYPYIADIDLDRNRIPVDYTDCVQTGSGSTSHLGAYDYMAACSHVPVEGEVAFDFNHLGCLVQLKLVLPEAGEYLSVTLKASEKLFVSNGYYDLMADEIQLQPQTLSDTFVIGLKNVKTSAKNEEVVVYALMAPVDLSSHKIEVIASDANDKQAKAFVQMKKMMPGVAYSVSANLEAESQPPTPGGDEDGVVSVEQAGTLEKLLGETKYQLTELKVKGKLNSDDIGLIRRMAGSYRDTTDVDFGVLKSLDLSQVTLVPGGKYYYFDGKNKYTIKSSDAVGACMFYACSELESLVLPANITSIDEAAISSCVNLKNIVIPDGVTSFGISAFNSCKSLESIQLPSNLTSMGSDVFHTCTALKSITIPDGVKDIQAKAFGHCKNLTEINLPAGLVSIGTAAFAACDKLETIVIPNTVEGMGQRAFGSCVALSSVSLSSGQYKLDSYTFENCTALTSISIPEGMGVIASRAFMGCVNLTRYQLPSTLVELEDRAFYTVTFKSPIVVECAATIPPVVGQNVWKIGEHSAASKLYVKSTSVEDYQSSDWKGYFGEILPKK